MRLSEDSTLMILRLAMNRNLCKLKNNKFITPCSSLFINNSCDSCISTDLLAIWKYLYCVGYELMIVI